MSIGSWQRADEVRRHRIAGFLLQYWNTSALVTTKSDDQNKLAMSSKDCNPCAWGHTPCTSLVGLQASSCNTGIPLLWSPPNLTTKTNLPCRRRIVIPAPGATPLAHRLSAVIGLTRRTAVIQHTPQGQGLVPPCLSTPCSPLHLLVIPEHNFLGCIIQYCIMRLAPAASAAFRTDISGATPGTPGYNIVPERPVFFVAVPRTPQSSPRPLLERPPSAYTEA
ncbi:hypothetical protein V495_03287 [Pseudogymnoascus sp. VKM F-4514 (FW-929)]|nr:hypothetical protein V495_03287 [Pseudogymnoascus sp. VKM F-4514 (FW-929)]